MTVSIPVIFMLKLINVLKLLSSVCKADAPYFIFCQNRQK